MSVQIAGLDVDVFVTEEHSHECEVTELPVESGSEISDHVRVKPDVVTVEGIVSDTPVGQLSVVRQPDLDAGVMPSDAAYDFLKRLRSARQTFSIVTSRARYENMVVQSLNISETADTGDALRFRATFKQIAVVVTARATVRVSTPRKAKTPRGHKSSETKGFEGKASSTFELPSELLYRIVN